MNKSLWLGGILGGLAIFIWTALSWMALPLHQASFEAFTDEAAVTAAIGANATAPGVYMLPNPHAGEQSLNPEQRKARQEAAMQQWQKGPSGLIAIRLGDERSMAAYMGTGLLIYLLAGVLMAWLVSRTSGLSYWSKVGFVVVTALTVGVLAYLPEWNWWGFSPSYVGAQFVDLAVGGFLGGLVIAKFSK